MSVGSSHCSEFAMKRLLIAALAAVLAAQGASAASPKIESAITTFKQLAGDPAKVKLFCDMVQTMDAMGDKEDAAAEAKVTDMMKQLGPAFEAAWNAADDLDENSADGQAYSNAMDELTSKCSQ